MFDSVPQSDRPAPEEEKYINEQWGTWLEALELAPRCRWVNPPASASAFENKIKQLNLAEKVGFRVPKTIVTNDPVQVRDFARQCGPIVAKALFAPLLEGEKEDRFAFTTRVGAGDITDDAALAIAPTIFQEASVSRHSR